MTDGNGNGAGGSRTIELGDRTITVEPPSGRKASRAFALIRAIGKEAPALVEAWGEFETDYAATHYMELDRVNAELRYGPEPLVVEGEVIRHQDGHPRAGEPVMLPGALESMTDEAWRSVDNKLRLPKAPPLEAKVLNIVRHEAIDDAEENVYRLLALFAMSNADVKAYRRGGTLNEELDRLVDELLDDAGLDELAELAVTVGEVIDEQFRRKASLQGDRLGNALRVLGLEPRTLRPQTPPQPPQTAQLAEDLETPTTDSTATSTDTATSSSSTSSGDGATDSDGDPTPPSTPTGERSPDSALALSRSD